MHNVVWTSNTYWWGGTPDEHRFAMNSWYNGSWDVKAPKDFTGRSVWPMRKF